MARPPASTRFGLRGSIAFRLAVGYGVLLAASMATLSAIVYFGTVGVFEHSIDNKIMAVETHLADAWVRDGRTGLVREIDAQLHDLIDTDTEVVGLVDAKAHVLAGNLGRWYGDLPASGELAFGQMDRNGAPVSVRLIATRLEDGSRLVVGRDLIELDAIRSVVERALLVSGAVSILLAFFGAQIFRSRLEARIGRIRRTTARIAAGELSSRIVVMGNDEFARLADDINRMLDRIEALMEGVRHVSNSIAHDLRTPLSRVRSRLDRALQASADPHALVADARLAIEDIDSVISLFDKLLQIAALESGVRAGTFEKLDLAAIAHDMTELYEAAAEEQGVALHFTGTPTTIRGDRDLLASALASLIDNAIKYGRNGGRVDVDVATIDGAPALTVRDYGQGVPLEDMDKLTRRFYALMDKRRKEAA